MTTTETTVKWLHAWYNDHQTWMTELDGWTYVLEVYRSGYRDNDYVNASVTLYRKSETGQVYLWDEGWSRWLRDLHEDERSLAEADRITKLSPDELRAMLPIESTRFTQHCLQCDQEVRRTLEPDANFEKHDDEEWVCEACLNRQGTFRGTMSVTWDFSIAARCDAEYEELEAMAMRQAEDKLLPAGLVGIGRFEIVDLEDSETCEGCSG